MGFWSPSNAMKAYVHTLQLCKDYYNKGSGSVVEPECIEFISALAAGNQAQLMVEITLDGFSSSTLALAIAARYTGGRLICMCHDQKSVVQTRSRIEDFNLFEVVHFEVGDPREVIKKYKNIDFAVVDHRIDSCREVLLGVDMNPNGSVLVLSNLFHESCRGRASYADAKNNGRRFESVILPIGIGMEVTKIGNCIRSRSRKSKRTFVVHEE